MSSLEATNGRLDLQFRVADVTYEDGLAGGVKVAGKELEI